MLMVEQCLTEISTKIRFLLFCSLPYYENAKGDGPESNLSDRSGLFSDFVPL